eukprot:960755-Prymnesium_polylepis.1
MRAGPRFVPSLTRSRPSRPRAADGYFPSPPETAEVRSQLTAEGSHDWGAGQPRVCIEPPDGQLQRGPRLTVARRE